MTTFTRLTLLSLAALPLLAACTGSGTVAATSQATVIGQTTADSAMTGPATPTTSSAAATPTSPAAKTATVTAITVRTVTAQAPTAAKQTVRSSPTELAFATPSGRIGCYMTATLTECEYAGTDRLWSLRPSPGCPSSGGTIILMYELPFGNCTSASPLLYNAAMDSRSNSPVGLTSWWRPGDPTVVFHGTTLAALPYGTSLVLGAYRCSSAQTGVTCRNESTGYGFSLSRETYQLFRP